MIYLALIWPLLWIAHAIWAPAKTGKANRTTLLSIERALQEVMWDGSITRFVFVQERGEFRLYKGLTAAIGAVAIGVAIAFGVDPVALLIGAPLGLCVIEVAVRSLSDIDVAGHGAEIMAAEATLTPGEAATYRVREAGTVGDQYDISTGEALVWLDKMHWLARVVYRLGAS